MMPFMANLFNLSQKSAPTPYMTIPLRLLSNVECHLLLKIPCFQASFKNCCCGKVNEISETILRFLSDHIMVSYDSRVTIV